MKKVFLMFAFASFTALAASAQTEPTASTKATTEKSEHCSGASSAKMCTMDKANCTKDAKACCAMGSKSNAKSTSMAVKADTKKAKATNK